MEDNKPFEKILEKIDKLSSISDAVLITKTGMLVFGSVRKSTSLEKFIGMAAILMGSAEAASLELGDSLRWVVIQTKSKNLAITSVSENILLIITFSGKRDVLDTLGSVEQILTTR